MSVLHILLQKVEKDTRLPASHCEVLGRPKDDPQTGLLLFQGNADHVAMWRSCDLICGPDFPGELSKTRVCLLALMVAASAYTSAEVIHTCRQVCGAVPRAPRGHRVNASLPNSADILR
jgi:hypothetical protein